MLPVLASDRSSNQLQKETKKLQEVRGRDFGFVPRKKKLKNANASFYQNRGGQNWNHEMLTPFRGTTETEGFNLAKQHGDTEIPALDEMTDSPSTLGMNEGSMR